MTETGPGESTERPMEEQTKGLTESPVGHSARRRRLIGCMAVVVVAVVAAVALIGYASSHGDQMPAQPTASYTPRTYSLSPVVAQSGTGSATPPHLVYRTTEPLNTYLTVEMHSDYFMWVPGGEQPSVRSGDKLVATPSPCPSSVPGTQTATADCRTRTLQGLYYLAAPGQVALQWTLIAQSPQADAFSAGGGFVPGPPCPARLSVPPTSAEANCVVATASVYVDVPPAASAPS